MLRTPASSVLRKGLVRSAPAFASRASSTQAISNPTLANIEKRWEGMPLQEQADLWMALRDRMKGSWTDLTVQEKKAGACYFSISENASRVAELVWLIIHPSPIATHNNALPSISLAAHRSTTVCCIAWPFIG